MIRGTFANIRIKNFSVRDKDGNAPEGGWAVHQPSGERMSIYDAAMRYQRDNVPLVVFAGIEYGNGSLARLGGERNKIARRPRGHRAEL